MNESDARKWDDVLTHGYGGKPGTPPSEVIGLSSFVPRVLVDGVCVVCGKQLGHLTVFVRAPSGPMHLGCYGELGPPTPARPPREKYTRCTVEAHGYTLEPAVEWRPGDDFADVVSALSDIARHVAKIHTATDAEVVSERMATLIARQWPDRAYFVEVWQDGVAGFAQIFQPFGVPRNP